MIKIIERKKEKGFALIEVMIAALVLTLGCLAFLKLQRTGMQYSFNDYARSQGVAISQGFAEKLRGNMIFLNKAIDSGSISSADTGLLSKLPQQSSDCQSSRPGTDCAKAMLTYQSYLTGQQMQALLKGQSRLCYLKHNSATVRLTFMWVDNVASEEAKKNGIQETDCPATFDGAVGKDFIDNSVTIYVQL